ncbi:MAG: IgGFc-binding protein [Myxococcota bacterium]
MSSIPSKFFFLFFFLFIFPPFYSCGDETNSNNTSNNNTNNNDECEIGQQQCFLNELQICGKNGTWEKQQQCGEDGTPPICDPETLECVDCIAGENICGNDGHVHVCTSDNEIGQIEEICQIDEGEGCIVLNGNSVCNTPCNNSATAPSYRGCDFWSVSTVNTDIPDDFDENFALVIDNSNSDFVSIEITGNNVQQNLDIAPDTVKVVTLPFNLDIKNGGATPGAHDYQTKVYRTIDNKGAYHIRSSLPITVYQFNPYDYTLNEHTSNSNDASLLLPTPVLTGNYLVMSREAVAVERLGNNMPVKPGFVTIVGTQENTRVDFTSTAYTIGGDSIGSLSPGDSTQIILNEGDVVQIISDNNFTWENCPESEGSQTSGPDGDMFNYCHPGNDYDLTGSSIQADKPIMVTAGHSCALVPFDYRACDHLEEVLFPLETWGNHFFIGLTHPVEEMTIETNVVRILSGAQQTITVELAPSIHDTIELDPGEYFEFIPAAGNHLEIKASGPVMVGKFTVGQRYWTESQVSAGDPSFGLVIPVEQFRTEYSFATPASMERNFVNVISLIPDGSQEYIILNGEPITPDMYEPVNSGYGVARIEITGTNAHNIHSPNENIRFGIEVYGFANYTSYLYPGGLDLQLINPVE